MAWPETVRESDLRIEYKRGSGAGGQKRNKRDTAVRITHLPTGITASSEDQRSQFQNKKKAFERLADRLIPLMMKLAKTPKIELETKTVRSYRVKDRKVVDERLTDRVFDYYDVLDGSGLEDIIKCLIESETAIKG